MPDELTATVEIAPSPALDAEIDAGLDASYDPALHAELDAKYGPVSGKISDYDRQRMAEIEAAGDWEDELGGPWPSHDPEWDKQEALEAEAVEHLHETGYDFHDPVWIELRKRLLRRATGQWHRACAPQVQQQQHSQARSRAPRARRTRTAGSRRGPPRLDGDDDPSPPSGDPDLERFFARVELSLLCWRWLGARTAAGYGCLRVGGQIVYAHRFAYARLVGAIPSGLEIDHLCRNRACVNPLHLEPVKHRENVLRGVRFRRNNEVVVA